MYQPMTGPYHALRKRMMEERVDDSDVMVRQSPAPARRSKGMNEQHHKKKLQASLLRWSIDHGQASHMQQDHEVKERYGKSKCGTKKSPRSKGGGAGSKKK